MFSYRLFLSAEPPPALEKGLPISLLQNCIKLTNEPPEGLKVIPQDLNTRFLLKSLQVKEMAFYLYLPIIHATWLQT